MFATPSSSPRERYVSALSRVRQAEVEYAAYLVQQEHIKYLEAQQRRDEQARAARARKAELEYAAYLAQQERARRLQAQQRRNEQARAAAVKRMQIILLHAAVSSLLNQQDARDEPQRHSFQAQIEQQPVKPTPKLKRRNHVRFVRPADKPVSAVETALKHRLASESNVEVHSTIQSILSQLSAEHVDVPIVSRSSTAIQHVARAFRILTSEFAFPSQLDFTPQSSSGSYPAAKLPYTPRNAPVRQYEHALNDLLSQLDAIASEGDATVRQQRKLVVGMVEKALEDLDRIIEGRWKLQDTRGNSTRSDASASAVASSSIVNRGEYPAPDVETETSQATPTPQAESRSTPHVREPSQMVILSEETKGQGETSLVPVLFTDIEDGVTSQEELSQLSLSILGGEERGLGSESEVPPSNSQSAVVLAGPTVVETPTVPADEECIAEAPIDAIVPPSSPKSLTKLPPTDILSPSSLSFAVPLPDEDLVVVEDKDAESISSWSEIED
ncbi:BAG domain protein [Mycena venus]|uniref:BAG domain protein n=1 Tax=Mycena venus TaxID=2733690 RepID=A0A8H7CBU6_9AGAR|nr:BAG domain protein [Mycena venus]